MKHFPLRELGYAVGFIVLLAAIYVGSYYAMVERSSVRVEGRSIAVSHPRSPFARYPASSLETFFEPIHRLDRMIRHRYWRNLP